jgi:hypothetical protein
MTESSVDPEKRYASVFAALINDDATPGVSGETGSARTG